MPMIAEEYGVLVPEELNGYGDYGQVLEIVDSPTLRTSDYGQIQVIGTENKPIVGTVDPASWGRRGYGQLPMVKAAKREIAMQPISKDIAVAKQETAVARMLPPAYRPRFKAMPEVRAFLARMGQKARAVQLHSSSLLEDIKYLHSMGY